jgi:DNA primase
MVAAKEWVDFKAVKAAVTMQMVLEHYSLTEWQRRGDELRGPCPIHKGTKPKQFSVNITKNAFQCFYEHCKARGNVLDFVAKMESCSVRDAALKLAEWFKVRDREAPSDESTVRIAGEPSSGEVVPMICLNADVLSRAGFKAGDRFSIECEPGRIILIKIENSS